MKTILTALALYGGWRLLQDYQKKNQPKPPVVVPVIQASIPTPALSGGVSEPAYGPGYQDSNDYGDMKMLGEDSGRCSSLGGIRLSIEELPNSPDLFQDEGSFIVKTASKDSHKLDYYPRVGV